MLKEFTDIEKIKPEDFTTFNIFYSLSDSSLFKFKAYMKWRAFDGEYYTKPEYSGHPRELEERVDGIIVYARDRGTPTFIFTHSEFLKEYFHLRLLEGVIKYNEIALYEIKEINDVIHVKQIPTNEYGWMTEFSEELFGTLMDLSFRIYDAEYGAKKQ